MGTDSAGSAMLLGLAIVTVGLAVVYGTGWLLSDPEDRDHALSVFVRGFVLVFAVFSLLILSWVVGTGVLGVLHD